jgi:hypothetical protein
MLTYYGDGHGGFERVDGWGAGWNGMAHPLTTQDWDGDGHADLMAVDPTGAMILYQRRHRRRRPGQEPDHRRPRPLPGER